jgi:hypothetical protein
MMRAPISLHLAAAAALTLSLAFATGCGRNHAGTLMAPTGVRQAPALYDGSITGAVFFDPVNTPDLGVGPFPPTRIELLSGTTVENATLVAADSLGPFTHMYHFPNVRPGPYIIIVRSAVFLPTVRTGLYVREDSTEAGNVTLTVNPSAVSSSIEVIGGIPGYGLDQLGMGTTLLMQNTLGVWTLSPTSFLFMEPPAIPAGTYRFKFVTSGASTTNHLIGWGGSDQELLTVPVVSHPSVWGEGPATDLVVHFPTTASYAFTFDERRQRFDIQVATAPASPFARR